MRIVKWTAGVVLVGILGLFAVFLVGFGPGNFGRIFLGVGQSYDSAPPVLPAMKSPAILIFSKTNGFRDDAQIVAANAAIEKLVRAKGWSSYTTENAAVFNPAQLGKFKAVVWNSVSGDVLTVPQREAFRSWIEAGGGFVGLHGSGGDPEYKWKWYAQELIGAQFIGHTMGPQFQTAMLNVEDRNHPATRHLPARWSRTDEWYSFASNPRDKGFRVLVTIDESSYSPLAKLPLVGARNIAMGRDHPMIWTHCVGKGRAFYSALGHPASAYAEKSHLAMIAGAIGWAAGEDGAPCDEGGTAASAR